jgi:ubiquitin-like 1-activating enzyme E1 A
MQKAENEGLTYDPFLETDDLELKNKNEENLSKIVSMGTESKEGYTKHSEFYRKFATTYGIDYCPVYSVVGSVISQEIIKIA